MTVTILQGNVRDVLARLPSDHFDCVVTSPPYWGLRSYLPDGHPDKGLEIGLEPTLTGYLDTMTEVCRELRRVLKPGGTFWLNIGDSYSTHAAGKVANPMAKSTLAGVKTQEVANASSRAQGLYYKCRDIPEKNLLMVPNRLAIRLQEPWYAGRIKDVADRIWLAAMIDAEGCMFIHKRKAGTGNHSTYTKADGSVSSYSRTQDTFGAGLEVANTSLAIVERCIAITGIGSVCSQSPDQNNRRKQTIYRWNVRSNECRWIIEEVYPYLVAKQQQARVLLGCPSSGEKAAAAHAALIDLHNGKPTDVDSPAPASLHQPGWYVRSEIIWAKKNCMPESVTDRPTSSHEKVWLLTKSERYAYDADAVREPSEQPDRVRADTIGGVSHAERGQHSVGGLFTGAQTRNLRNVWAIATQPFSGAHFATMPPDLVDRCIKAGCPAGGHVLDPFGGAGTTGLAADRLGRHATLIELNPAYIDIAKRRIEGDAPLFAEVLA